MNPVKNFAGRKTYLTRRRAPSQMFKGPLNLSFPPTQTVEPLQTLWGAFAHSSTSLDDHRGHTTHRQQCSCGSYFHMFFGWDPTTWMLCLFFGVRHLKAQCLISKVIFWNLKIRLSEFIDLCACFCLTLCVFFFLWKSPSLTAPTCTLSPRSAPPPDATHTCSASCNQSHLVVISSSTLKVHSDLQSLLDRLSVLRCYFISFRRLSFFDLFFWSLDLLARWNPCVFFFLSKSAVHPSGSNLLH